MDEIVNEIAKETPLVKLVKEKVKPKRALKAWEIVLIIVCFPIWFPLALTALILALVAYLLVWILVLVSYSVELALTVSALGAFTAFWLYLFNGQVNFITLGASIMCAGAAILLFFGCIGATKITIKLSKNIMTGIKSAFIRKGKK